MALDFLTGCFGWRPSKLSRCSERSTRIWLWSLKLILIIPVAIAAFGAKDHYLTVKHHPELSQYPYNPRVELALSLTFLSCIIIFPWIFVSSLALIRFQGPWILLYGIIDFGLAVTLATGLGMQAEFLPGSLQGCSESKAQKWQVVDPHPSFFNISASIAGPKSTAKGQCREYVSDWTIAVSVVLFQMVISYVGIFFDEREFSILNPMRPFVWLIVLIIGPPILIHDLVFPRIRLGFSYIKKTAGRIPAAKDLKIPKMTQFKPSPEQFKIPDTKLIDILVIEHVMLNVVDYMHYEDVINLSLACKAARELVYPSRDLDHRIPKLKKRCCDTFFKSGCLYCNKRICLGCRSQLFLPGLPGQRHVTFCRPYCRDCYYKHFARHPHGYKKPCKCHSTDRSTELQDVCRTCATKDAVQMQILRHRRYQQQARDMAFGGEGDMGKCAGPNCKADLKAGTRWWVCLKCRGECRDSIHPPHVGRKKEKDVEKVEGAVTEQEERVEPWWRKWWTLSR